MTEIIAMTNAVRWSRIRRLEAHLTNRGGLDYPEAERDVQVALEELHHHLADASNLRVEKALVWEQVNREERRGRWLSWAGIASLWAVAGFLAWKVG